MDGIAFPMDSTVRPLTLTVTLPESLRGANRTYFLYRDHNGSITKLEGTLSTDGTQLTFTSDQFSAFALGYVETASGGGSGSESSGSNQPSTPNNPGGSGDPNAPSLSKPNDAEQTDKPGNPDTGDGRFTGLYLAAAALMLCAGGLTVLLRKRAR